MRLLMTMNVPYTRSHGGANRSNRGLIEGLARRGHDAWVVAPALAQPSPITYQGWLDELAELGVSWAAEGDEAVRFEWGGVRVVAVREPGQVRAVLVRLIGRLAPYRVLVSSEDPSQSLLAAALEADPGRVVYLALTPPLFPFGPASLYPSETRTDLIRRAGAVACLSRIVADYVGEHAGVPAFVYHPPSFGTGPFQRVASFDDGAVLLANACAVKGLPIFLELARRFPDRPFAALHGYGTTEADLAALRAQPNVALWRNERELDTLFRRTKIVLVPSLWMESFGMVVVDAMLRGIPVLAADHGALPEAALGTARLLPVTPITRYERDLDDNLLPVPIVPPQNCAAWVEALGPLLSDREQWEAAAGAAYKAATAYVAALSVEPFERMLAGLPLDRPAPLAPPAARPADGASVQLTPQQRAALLRRLRVEATREAAPAVRKLPRDTPLALSFAQSRLYFLWRLAPDSAAYNCPSALRLRGRLDAAALEKALADLVARHETLRTVIGEGPDGPVQHILPPAPPAFERSDLSLLPAERRADEARRLIARAAAAPFHLGRERPFRAHLIALGPDEHLLLLTMHHIATDGWSTGLIVRDLASLYAGHAGAGPVPPPDPARLDYADYAGWQAGILAGRERDRLLGYWTGELAGASPVIDLPTDRPRPTNPTRPGGNHPLVLPPALVERLKHVGRSQDASLFMVLLAGFGVLLHRLGGAGDIVVGTPVANRTRAEFETMLGFFVNTLPLRLRFSGNPRFIDFLARVRETAVAGFAHQALPIEQLVEALAPVRSSSYIPIFQVLFSLHNMPAADLSMPGLAVEAVPAYAGMAKLDLNLELIETAHGLEGTLEYDRELFDRDTIETFAEAYRRLLEAVTLAPERPIGALALAAPAAPGPIPPCRTSRSDPDLSELVRRGLALAPSATAVWSGNGTVDHRRLDIWSDRLALLLIEHAIRPGGAGEAAVALCLDRSAVMVAAVLGVLKAGAACVPLDPEYPAERLAWMQTETAVAAVLTESRHAGLFADSAVPVILLDDPALVLPAADQAWRHPAPHGLAPAYILYTSGSTGRPKGVSFPRAALANLVLWHLEKFPGAARILQFASLGFDASFHEILATLAGGGTLYMLDKQERRNLDLLPRFLGEHAIAKAILPVVAIHRLAEAMAGPDAPTLALRHLVSTGEALAITPAVAAWLARTPGLSLHNDYGPTETHVVTSAIASDLPDSGAPFPPIGRPIRATGIRILDAYLNPLPAGLPGELFLAGACLARGYHRRPEATAETFLPDPAGAPGERMYRTGDLVRERPDGQLVYLGRIDQQIKIRGHRIEPGEVEKALRDLPGVADSLVVARGAASAERRLVAYIVAEPSGAVPEPRLLAEGLRRVLPPFMVPAAFVPIARFPLTANGKIDRAALPAPTAADTEAGDQIEGGAPQTELQTALARIWSEVLQRPTVGIDSNFFALGGHSLLMIQVIARIARDMKVEIPVQQFFDYPTIAAQAVVVADLIAARAEEADIEALLDEIEELPAAEAERLIAAVQPNGAGAIDAWTRSAIGSADPTVPVPIIETIGFPSSGRAELLDRAIRSYAANLLEHGRRLDLVVTSDPADPAEDDAYRAMLGGVARDTGLPVRYAGTAEKRAFVDRLAGESGLDPELLAWAIGDAERSGRAYGANRNALLLDGAGSLFLSFDDDTTARLRLPHAMQAGVALQTEPGVGEIRVLSDGAGEADFTGDAALDLVGAHQGFLGRPVGAVLRTAGSPQVGRSDPAALGPPDLARVVASYHGWAGDSGWESGAEARFLSGAAWEWLTRSEDAYWEALENPALVRYAPQTTLSRAPEFFALGSGFDGSADLPPFLPRFRREDVLWGVSLRHGCPGGFVAHLPVLIGHGRPRGGVRAGQDTVDVAQVVETIFDHLPPGQGVEGLGAGLVESGRLSAADFAARVQGWVAGRIGGELDLLDQRIRRCPRDRSFWAQDAGAMVTILRDRLSRPGELLPRLAFRTISPEAAQSALQAFFIDLGRLFAAWPLAMAVAARLRADGVRLSRPIRTAG
jgi:amino acid adenylation domain-containing protein